jgi:pyruvate-formate lyase-activating enzyme
MSSKKVKPKLLYALPEEGTIYEHPQLCMLCRKGEELVPPKPQDLTPLPAESNIFLLPERRAVGMDPDSGEVHCLDELAVAAFISPGHTLSAHSAYISDQNASPLPLFAYGAVGYANGTFWVCAQKVDEDRRQQFQNIPNKAIDRGAKNLLQRFPKNRLIRHLSKCALTYCCPAAKNLALGRFECPLPTARGCNARCIGCISRQPQDSGFPATQHRIAFTPEAREITEVMHAHAQRESKPIFSFGQGCEGEPLTETSLIRDAVQQFRKQGGQGTVNINTNASLPESIAPLAAAGLNSIRVSLNSARQELYSAYYRPQGYDFEHVKQSIEQAKLKGLFVALNYLFFPGINDTEEELEALCELIEGYKVDFLQMRNLNLDPELYMKTVSKGKEPSMGLKNFMHRISEKCPWVGFGYFNPYLG